MYYLLHPDHTLNFNAVANCRRLVLFTSIQSKPFWRWIFFSVNKHKQDSIFPLSLTNYSSIQSELSLPQSSRYTFKMFPRAWIRARDWKLFIISGFGSNIYIEANWLNVIFEVAQSDSWLSNSPLRTHFKTTLYKDTHKTAEYSSAQAKQIHILYFGREELEIALKGSTSQYFKYFFCDVQNCLWHKGDGDKFCRLDRKTHRRLK